MREKPGSKLIALAVASCFASTSQGKTTYVEIFGDDTNPCTRSEPCLTIQTGIDQAGAKGRIIVGPGSYDETESATLNITNESVRLTSVAGAHATVLSGADTPTIVNIAADKVTFGQKRKGFTITTDSGNDVGVLLADGTTSTKIEGNILSSTDSMDYSRRAISSAPGPSGVIKTTIRNNWIVGWTEAILLYGRGNGGGGGKERYTISDNRIESRNCTTLYNPGPANAIKVKDNRMDCGRGGIYLFHGNDVNPFSAGGTVKTNVKIQRNVISAPHIGLWLNRGNHDISGNLINGADRGMSLDRLFNSRIRNNLIRNSTSYDIQLFGDEFSAGNQITSNTMVNTGMDSLSLIDTVPRTLSRNNFDEQASCAIEVNPVPSEVIAAKKNFWGDPDSVDGLPPLVGCNAETIDASDPGIGDPEVTLTFSPVLKANPIKYKSPL